MAAARRYAIAGYDRTGLARTMYTRPFVGTFIAVALAAFFALFMYAAHGGQSVGSLDIFGFIPEELIHDMGIGVMVVVFLAGLAGVVTMARRLGRAGGVTRALRRREPAVPCVGPRSALWSALAVESLGQRRYRADCDADAAAQPWFRRRWFIHAATMWGFLGLLAATILDYGLALVGIKATGTPVPIWYPVRLLGTVAGILLVYGATMLIVQRFRGDERSVRHSTAADWTFLALVWITGVTGLRDRDRALPAERARLGLLGLPLPRRGRDGARPPRPVHEVRPCGLPPGRAVLPRPGPGAGRGRLDGAADA